jgi:hypothetical protein
MNVANKGKTISGLCKGIHGIFIRRRHFATNAVEEVFYWTPDLLKNF